MKAIYRIATILALVAAPIAMGTKKKKKKPVPTDPNQKADTAKADAGKAPPASPPAPEKAAPAKAEAAPESGGGW